MRFNEISSWLTWLETLHPRAIDLGLNRVQSVAERLDIDASHSKIVTIAGTNGKGSCVATLASLARAANCRVGCYTSPHLLTFNERIVIDGAMVQDVDLLWAFDRVDNARQGLSLTYFEFVTLAALVLLSRARLDLWLLEVGLGGRLDAVNIIDADVAIITQIALDHTDWLGNDREAIAVEKAGIFRANKPAICGDPNPPLAIARCAEQTGAVLYQRGRHFDVMKRSHQHWCWRGVDAHDQPVQIDDLPWPSLPLASVAAAIASSVWLGLKVGQPAYQSLDRVALPGRFQCVEQQGSTIIFDVAHNPAAATYLAKQLQRLPCAGRTYTLFGVMADKDYASMITAMKPYCEAWFIADLANHTRAVAASLLAEALDAQGISDVHVSADCYQAYRNALSMMTKGDRLVIWGSFYWVAELNHQYYS